MECLGKLCQLERSALILGRSVTPHERAEAGAIDLTDPRKVQHDLGFAFT